jgi:hypothetical protein
MRNKIRIIGVGLLSMAGILLVSGVAWAQAVETPITVQFHGCHRLEEPVREWVDEDGIEHVRDELFTCNRTRDMVGRDIGWASWDTDGAANHYSERGYYAFTGWVLGGGLTTGVGRYTVEGERINGVWNYTSEDVMHLDGGGLVKLSGAWKAGDRVIYRGTFLETPGGAKRHGPRYKK